MKKETEEKKKTTTKKTVKRVSKPKEDSIKSFSKEKILYVVAVSCILLGGLLYALIEEINHILTKPNPTKIEEKCDIKCDKPQSLDPKDDNRVPEVYSDLLDQIDYSAAKDYNKDGKTAVLVEGDGVEYIGFISNKHVYISVPNLNGDGTVFFRVKNINNASKIRIFNQMGFTGFAPAFYVICEDGKVYEVPAYYVSKDLVISEVFEEYKVADIIELDVGGCDEEASFCGYAELLLQDGKTIILK